MNSLNSQPTNGMPATALVCRGVRGAISVEENTAEAILAATRELLYTMIQANGIGVEDVVSAIFTTTPDLNAAHPALAARQLGWSEVSLLCSQEIGVPGSLPRCVRILIHWNTTRRPPEIQHVYLGKASVLRPDRPSVAARPAGEIRAATNFDLGVFHFD